jgi:hypothetical protein
MRARPVEAGRLTALRAIPSPPKAAAKALQLAQTDIAELDRAIADYRSGNSTIFRRDVKIWWNDARTTVAFVVLGATACGD